MKKQIDWDVRVWRLTPSGQEGSATREAMLAYMAEHYPLKDGWEVVSVSSPGYEAGAVNLVVFVSKYETVTESVIYSGNSAGYVTR